MSSLPDSCALNLELKARVADLVQARVVARQLTTRPMEELVQLDTYFQCDTGRFKLRQFDSERGQLIWYQRASQHQAKSSFYKLVDIFRPEEMKNLLATTLGIRVVVQKQREVYFYRNVRIHLDQVQSLGTFLEFEAVLENADQIPLGQKQLDFLGSQFSIADQDLMEGSYSEMLEDGGK